MEEMLNILGMLENADGPVSIFLAANNQMIMISMIVTVVIGLVIARFGLKLIRVLSALVGLLLGAGIGFVIGIALNLDKTPMIVLVGVGAVILCILMAVLKKFGIFFLIFFYSLGTLFMLLKPTSLILVVICLVASVILAVLAVLFTDLLVILITGITGGVEAGMALPVLFGMGGNVWIGYALSAAFFVIGCVIQTMMHSRKVGKKERIYSKKVKEEVSMESEVEKARMMLDDDDVEDLDDDDTEK